MKTKCKIIHSSLLGASLLALPALVQAQSYTNSSGIIYTVNSGTITITGYTGPGGDVIIPDRIPDIITGLPVTTIGDSAFYNRHKCNKHREQCVPVLQPDERHNPR
jgi:hypothetical protein